MCIYFGVTIESINPTNLGILLFIYSFCHIHIIIYNYIYLGMAHVILIFYSDKWGKIGKNSV